VNCPLCVDQTLDAMFYDGIEVDICPKCRGIWLDRGELDRLAKGQTNPMFASNQASAPQPASFQTSLPNSGAKEPKEKKKKSKKHRLAGLLDDLLDEVL
jgi:Zn-finger nucleic acid-binding protein